MANVVPSQEDGGPEHGRDGILFGKSTTPHFNHLPLNSDGRDANSGDPRAGRVGPQEWTVVTGASGVRVVSIDYI